MIKNIIIAITYEKISSKLPIALKLTNAPYSHKIINSTRNSFSSLSLLISVFLNNRFANRVNVFFVPYIIIVVTLNMTVINEITYQNIPFFSLNINKISCVSE